MSHHDASLVTQESVEQLKRRAMSCLMAAEELRKCVMTDRLVPAREALRAALAEFAPTQAEQGAFAETPFSHVGLSTPSALVWCAAYSRLMLTLSDESDAEALAANISEIVQFVPVDTLLVGSKLRIEGLHAKRHTDPDWTTPDSPSKWAKMFDVTAETFVKLVNEGKVRAKKLTSKRYQIAIDDLPAKHQSTYRPATK